MISFLPFVILFGTHENKGGISFQLRIYVWKVSKDGNLPKAELNNFDGVENFTQVNQVENYFEMYNIVDDKQNIHVGTLKFGI